MKAKEKNDNDDNNGFLYFFIIGAFLFLVGLFIYDRIFHREETKEYYKYVIEFKKLEFYLQDIKDENLKIAKDNFEKKENNILNKGLYKDIVDENGELLSLIIEKFETEENVVEVEIIVENSYFDEFIKNNFTELMNKIDNIAKKNNYYLSNEKKEKKAYFVKGLERWEISYISSGIYGTTYFEKGMVYLKKSDKDTILKFYKELEKKFPNQEYYFNQNEDRIIPVGEFGILERALGEEIYKKYLKKGIKIKLYYKKSK